MRARRIVRSHSCIYDLVTTLMLVSVTAVAGLLYGTNIHERLT